MAWSPVAQRYCTAYARHGRHPAERLVSAAGVPGRPSVRAAARTPRSPAVNASGSPRPRMAIVSTLHGPRPGSALSAARACCQSLPGPRSIAPLASALVSAANVACRVRGTASVAGSAAASAVMLGNRCVSPPAESSAGSPCASTSRAAWVRAAAVETCWPSTTRTANSAGSTVRGTRRPGAFRTSGPSSGSSRSTSPMATGSASRSSSRRHRLIAIARSRRSVRASWHPMYSGPGRSATMPRPCGSRSVRR